MKSVFFDNNLFNINYQKDSFGILIGQKQGVALNVFLSIQCPPDSSQVNETDELVIKCINSKWVGQHAINVFRMLPGSTTIVGFYVVTEHSNIQKCSAELEGILSNIYQKEKKINYDLFNDDSGQEKIVLLIDPSSSKFIVRKINLSDNKLVFKNVEFKFSDIFSAYRTVQSNICVRIDTIMPSERDKELILRHLKDAVNPFITEFVTKSIMLVNGQQLSSEKELDLQNDILMPSKDDLQGDIFADNSLVSTSSQSTTEIVFVGVNMQSCLESSVDSDTDNEFEMINRLKIQGRIPGIAFLPQTVTVGDVELALKKDLTRSLYSRLELLTEELHITGGEMEVSQILLPQRVKVSLPVCLGFPLSDYKFFSETASDVISRVRYFCRPAGMTDDELDLTCINVGIELSEQASLSDELSEVEPLDDKELKIQSITQPNVLLYFVSLSAVVFLISILAYYFLN